MKTKLSEVVANHNFKHIFSDYVVAFGNKHDRVVEIIYTGSSGDLFESGYYSAHSIVKPNISVSSMRGCPVSCQFCELGRAKFGGHLTHEEMYEQVLWTLLQAQNFTDINVPSKVSFGKSGEPLLNLNLLAGLERVSELGVSFRIPTSFPRGALAERVFEEVAQFAGRYSEPVQLNISLISTDEGYRAKTTKIGADFRSIRKGVERWLTVNPLPRGRKPNVALIIANDTPVDPNQLLEILPPELVNVCFRPYVETSNGKNSGLSLLSEGKLMEFKRRFEERGYSVNVAHVSTPVEIKFRLASNSTLRRYKGQIAE